MKKLIVCFSLLALLTACCEETAKKAVEQQKVVEQQKPVDPGCEVMPGLTNDQIIDETRKCETAGLDAQALHCGDDYTTIAVQCKPRSSE